MEHRPGQNKQLNKLLAVVLLGIVFISSLGFPRGARLFGDEIARAAAVLQQDGSYVVYSWEDLKELIESSSNANATLNITIDGAIAAKSEITIGANQTINLNAGNNGAIIYGALDGTKTNYQIGNNKYTSMFIVNGGTLNVGQNVVLSGQRAVYQGDTCTEVVKLNQNSVVNYVHSTERNKYDFSDFSDISYTPSVARVDYDFSTSDISYVPREYPSLYDFTGFTTTYTPGSDGNSYAQFTYQMGNISKFGIVSARQEHAGGDAQDTTAICTDIDNREWKMYFSRNPQKPYAVLTSQSGVGDWIRVGFGTDDDNRPYYYFYATEFNKRVYISADGSLVRDWGSIFDNGKDGRKELRWYPTGVSLEAQIDVVNPTTGLTETVTHYMHREDDGLITFPTTASFAGDTGLYVAGDKQVRTPENAPIITGSWGRVYRVYPAINDGGNVKNGAEIENLTVGSVYHIQADNGDGWYTALAVQSDGATLTQRGSRSADPNTEDNFNAPVVWKYMGDGTFRSEYPSWWNENQRLTIYWDGKQVKSTSWSNWQQLKVPSSSSLKIKGTAIYKPTNSSSGLATTGDTIKVLDAESLVEVSGLTDGAVVVLQANRESFFNSASEWVSEPEDETAFKWTYSASEGTLSNGDYKIYIESDGTNPRVVDSKDRGATPTSDAHLYVNGGATELFKGTPLSTTAGGESLILFVANGNAAPIQEATSTLSNGTEYIIMAKNGGYLRWTDGSWIASPSTWSNFTWTYNSADGTFSHGNKKIYVDENNAVTFVDSSQPKVAAVDPALKINNQTVYKGSLFSTTSGDPVYLYTIEGTPGNYKPGAEVTSLASANDGNPFYVKAGDQWLLKEANTDATWGAHPGESRQYNTVTNPYVWTYDATNKTLSHGDYKIFIDGTVNTVVDSTEKTEDEPGKLQFNGTVRFATTSGTNLFTTANNANSIYLYDVGADGSVGNEAPTGLVVGNYYYLRTKTDSKYLQANTSGGTWTDLGTQTTQSNDFAWKFVNVTRKDGNSYKVLYNEATDQYIYHDGNKLTMGVDTVEHCPNLAATRWVPIDKKNSTDVSNWHHTNNDLKYNKNQSEKKARGYFITAENGATVNVNGASFVDFWAGDGGAVLDYAPISINNSTFVMNSGEISNNKVGYIANDSKSGMQVQGYNPEDNVYGGAEQYIKKTAMTNTAGGVIFTNGAVGSITGTATIKQNKGDVGGILVQGAKTDVTLGGYITGTISDNPDDPYENVQLTTTDGGHIDQNVGFHHAGAALVENGGTLRMVGVNSTMNQNVTWAKGGAVWVTDFGTNGYAKIDYKNKKLLNNDQRQNQGIFIMKNGTLDNNTAFVRAGGINVESNRVHLLGGTISNNNSRALGGGIYVEGDFPDYTYTLLIDKGYIGNNYAVRYWSLDDFSTDENDVGGLYDEYTLRQLNDRLDRKLGQPDAEGNPLVDEKWNPTNNTYFANQPGGYANRTADTWAYPKPHEGNGGGVWLCPIGGTAIFHLHNNHEVIVDDNYASGFANGDKKNGTDLYLHSGTGHLLVSNSDYDGEDWENEFNGKPIEGDGTTYSGPLYLINVTDDGKARGSNGTYGDEKNAYHVANYNAQEANNNNQNGIRIINNVSRDGGGIAANGTLLFGAPKDVYRHEAKLGFKKIWPTNADTYPVTFKMFYKDPVKGITELDGYEFHLNGVAGDSDDYDKSPETTGSNSGQQSNGEHHWTANTTIPVTVETTDINGDPILLPLYKFKYTGSKTSITIQKENGLDTNGNTLYVDEEYIIPADKVLDPSTEDGMKAIYALAKAGEQDQFKVAEWNIILKEYNAVGMEIKEAEFSSITSGDILITEGTVDVIDAGGLGKKIKGYTISFSEATFTSEAKNGEGPSVEKYINNKVHQGLGSFDEVFEYSIMAYVPLDAVEIVIEDTLEEPLMFVENGWNYPGNQYAAAQVVGQHGQFLKNGNEYNVVTNGLDYWIVVGPNEYYQIYNPKKNDSTNELTSFSSISQTAQTARSNTSVWATYKKGVSTYLSASVVDNSSLNGYELVIEDENNHKGNGLPLGNANSGTVTGHTNTTWFSNHPEKLLNGPIAGNTIEIGRYDGTTFVKDATGNTIRATITEEMLKGTAPGSTANQVDAHGKWIVMSFDVAIKPEYRTVEALKTAGWITEDESKIGEVNFLSDLEQKEDVTITKLYYNSSKGLYYALAEENNNRNKTHRYVYVSSSPDKIRNMDDGTQPNNHEAGVEKDEYVANEWYEMYRKNGTGHGRYRSISYPAYDDVNLWHAYYKDPEVDSTGNVTTAYELAEDVTHGNVNVVLNASGNATINGHVAVPKDYYNYPVIEGEVPHAGVKNRANYIITYPHGGTSTYKTNIVTVDVNVPEKYVNHKVHQLLLKGDAYSEGAFDEPFEYEIMVYVPNDATEVIIYDTLRPDLMFEDHFGNTQFINYTVGTASNPDGTKDTLNTLFHKENGSFVNHGMVNNTSNYNSTGETRYQLVVLDSNNHIGDGVNGSVLEDGSPINVPINSGQVVVGTLQNNATDATMKLTDDLYIKQDLTGNTLAVKIDDAASLEQVRGKWVKLSFKAQIKPSAYDEVVKKIAKENEYTTDRTKAADYDPATEWATPVGYLKKSAQYTFIASEALGYTTYVPDSSKKALAPLPYDGDDIRQTSNIVTPDKTRAVDYNSVTESAKVIGYLTPPNPNQDYTVFYREKPTGDYVEAYYSGPLYDYAPLLPENLIYIKAFDVLYKGEAPANENEGVDYVLVYQNKDWDATERWKTNGVENTGLPNWEKVTDNGNIKNPADTDENGVHAGLANRATYIVKNNSGYHTTNTNTVTVETKLRDLLIHKEWNTKPDYELPTMEEFKDSIRLWWEKASGEGSSTEKVEGELTNLYKDKIQVSYETTTNGLIYWSISVKDLPVLRPSLKYFLTETRLKGFNPPEYRNGDPANPDTTTEHAHDGGYIVNIQENEEDETHLSVSKVWDVGSLSQSEIDAIGNNEHITVALVREDSYTGETVPVYKFEKDSNGNWSKTSPAEQLTTVLNAAGRWGDTFTGLPLYELNDDGSVRPLKDQNGYFHYFDKNHTEFKVKLENSEIKVEELDGTAISIPDRATRGIAVSTVNGNLVVDLQNTDPVPVVAQYSIQVLDDPEGYILSYEVIEKTNYTYTYTSEESESLYWIGEGDDRQGLAVGYFLQDGSTGEYTIFTTIAPPPGVPSTGPGLPFKRAYVKEVKAHSSFIAEIVNTKPQIEKYINKDVHADLFYTTDIVYDILVYVPEDATEIEIEDEVLNTLKLKNFLEPVLDDSNMITDYAEVGLDASSLKMAVHVKNDHTVKTGTVSNKNTAGSVTGQLAVDGNRFTITIPNIVHWASEYIEDSNGDYIKLTNGKYLKVRENGVYLSDYSEELLPAQLISQDYTRADMLFYTKISGEKSFYEDSAGAYALCTDGQYHLKSDLPITEVMNGSNQVRYVYIGSTDSYEPEPIGVTGNYVKGSDGNFYPIETFGNNGGVSIVDANPGTSYSYIIEGSGDYNRIGGRYVQVSFAARVNPDKEDALKDFVKDSSRSNKPNEAFDWDVITTTGNTGWDLYITSLGYDKATQEYIPVSENTILSALVEKVGKDFIFVKRTAADGEYYAAVEKGATTSSTDAKVYVYPIGPSAIADYSNEWIEVRYGPEYFDLDGVSIYKNGSSPLAGVEAYRYGNIRNYAINNASSNLVTDSWKFIPIVPDEVYLKIDDRYYLEMVALNYAPEDKLTDEVLSNRYVKLDWGRGDGDLNRDVEGAYEGDHTGVVNTASYRVTYGNGIRSRHKSNTVTVVPRIYELPSSGGIGTYLHTILGTMFLSLGLFFLVRRRKKKEKRGFSRS